MKTLPLRRLAVLGALASLVAGTSPARAGSAILLYNFWSTPGNGGYDNLHFDSDLIAVLEARGHTPTLVDRAAAPEITPDLLAPCRQLWLIAANNAQVDQIAPSEVRAVAGFRADGGGVALFGEHDDFFEDINRFAGAFDGRFQGWGVNHDTEIPTDGFVHHPLWRGVRSIGGATSEGVVAVLAPTFLRIVATHAGHPMVAVHRDPHGGRVLFDGSFVRLFDDEYLGAFSTSALEYDNETYLGNAADWLAICEPISVAPSSWGRVKASYRDR